MLPAATVQNKKCLAVPNIRYPFPQRDRRGAQAFDLAGITNTVGAPSFAHFAKGGSRAIVGSTNKRKSAGAGRGKCGAGRAACQTTSYRQHRRPPLQRTQGRGTHCTHCSGTGKENTESWATRRGPPAPSQACLMVVKIYNSAIV